MNESITSRSRRDFLAVAGAALVPVALTQESTKSNDKAAPLYRPSWAGRPRNRVTDYENDPFIVALEGTIKCTCGCNLDVYTCRTTDFTCAVSPAMHREVVSMMEDGMTGQEIVDAFVAQYGETVLMAPKKTGFNLTAYLLPGVTITAVGALIARTLVRRQRRALIAATSSIMPGVDADDQALLEEELTQLGH